MTVALTTKSVFPPIPTLQPLPVPFVKPLSYEFRVAEIVEDGVVKSVKLQVQTFEHDEFGVGVAFWGPLPIPQIKVFGYTASVVPHLALANAVVGGATIAYKAIKTANQE